MYPNANTDYNVYKTFPVPTGYAGQGQLELPFYLKYKSITSNGSYSIVNDRSSTSQLGYWKVDVNIPSDIDNANVNANNVIVSNGTYTVPIDKSGFNSFEVAVPQVVSPSISISFIDSTITNHPIHDYMYTRNTSGNYIYLEPNQYAEMFIKKR